MLAGGSESRAIAHSMSWWRTKCRCTRPASSTSAPSADPSRQRAAARAAGARHVLDLLRTDPLAHQLARDLADEIVVRRDLAANHRQTETPAGVDRHHARIAADRV